MDIVEKATAIQTLVATFKDLGDEERIDGILAACRGSSVAKEPEKRAAAKRGPYKTSGIYRALAEGVAQIPVLVERAERYMYVPGKTKEEKCEWAATQLKKSPGTYRDYGDGAWGLRRQNGSLSPSE